MTGRQVFIIIILAVVAGRTVYVWNLGSKSAYQMRANEMADVKNIIAKDPDYFKGKTFKIVDGPKKWAGKRDAEINQAEYQAVMRGFIRLGYEPYVRNYLTNRIILVQKIPGMTDTIKSTDTFRYEPNPMYQEYDEGFQSGKGVKGKNTF